MKTLMSLYILIDDVRDIQSDLIFRNGIIAKMMLPHVPWDSFHRIVLYMDHDLGLGPNGYQILDLIINHLKVYPDVIYLVTSNPVGKKNMSSLLLNDVDIYGTKDGRKFTKIGV